MERDDDELSPESRGDSLEEEFGVRLQWPGAETPSRPPAPPPSEETVPAPSVAPVPETAFTATPPGPSPAPAPSPPAPMAPESPAPELPPVVAPVSPPWSEAAPVPEPQPEPQSEPEAEPQFEPEVVVAAPEAEGAPAPGRVLEEGSPWAEQLPPPATNLPLVAGRIEGVHGAIATLSMRVDALASATNAFRTSLSDRMADYTETVARMSRTQSDQLEEYRHGSERALGELRRSITDSDDVLRRMAARLDEVVHDVGTLADQLRLAVAETRDAVTSTEKLARLVTDGLDSFADRILQRLDGLETEGVEQNAGLRNEMTRLHADLGDIRRLRADVAALKAFPAEFEASGREASNQVIEALDTLTEEVRRLTTAAAEPVAIDDAELRRVVTDLASSGQGGSEVAAAVDALSVEVRRLIRASTEPVMLEDSFLDPVRAELGRTSDELAGLRMQVAGFGAESVADLAGTVSELKGLVTELTAASHAVGPDIADAVDAVDALANEVRELAHAPQPVAPAADESALDGIREELTLLRRRLAARAKAPLEMDDDQLAALADAVAQRLAGAVEGTPARPARAPGRRS